MSEELTDSPEMHWMDCGEGLSMPHPASAHDPKPLSDYELKHERGYWTTGHRADMAVRIFATIDALRDQVSSLVSEREEWRESETRRDAEADLLRSRATQVEQERGEAMDECTGWHRRYTVQSGERQAAEILNRKLTAELESAEAEVERMRREWPDRNQYAGLGRAMGALAELRDALGMTSIGRHPAYRPGAEPSYAQVLRYQLESIERMIAPDFMYAKERIKGRGGR